MPEVRRVVGTEVTMGGAFFPPVKRPLMSAHVILARQHGMLLVPNDGLREVESAGFEDWWVIAAIGVTAPDVEAVAREQNAGDVAEPGLKKGVELAVADEVISQWPILGPQL